MSGHFGTVEAVNARRWPIHQCQALRQVGWTAISAMARAASLAPALELRGILRVGVLGQHWAFIGQGAVELAGAIKYRVLLCHADPARREGSAVSSELMPGRTAVTTNLEAALFSER